MKENFLTTELFFKDVFPPILLFPDDDTKLFVVAIGLYMISSKLQVKMSKVYFAMLSQGDVLTQKNC